MAAARKLVHYLSASQTLDILQYRYLVSLVLHGKINELNFSLSCSALPVYTAL